MSYAIEVLKEKLREEIIAELALEKARGCALLPSFEMTVQRRLDLQKALEVLMKAEDDETHTFF